MATTDGPAALVSEMSPSQLDRTYHFILQTFVERGDGPHYTEIGRHFGVGAEGGKHLLRDVMRSGLPAWLYPGTDLIASFAPFNNQPTHYRISVDGRQRWFAQCGLESLALCWLFPGKTIQIDAPCLDCGEPLRVSVRDGAIEQRHPEVVCYARLPLSQWSRDWPFT
jgi:hypothetical protein